jgi:AcrR family transcriptional regulator
MTAPDKRIERLWRQTPAGQRGPKPSLTLDQVVDDAIALADAKGLDAVTMRTLARQSRVAPMALYRYVGSKDELVDLMLDRTYAGMRRRSPSGRTWRARLTAIADDNYALYLRHPWAAQLVTNRPPLGPGMMGKYEYELGALENTSLPDVEKDAALAFVLGFVESCARATASTRSSRQTSQRTDRQWWRVHGPLLARVLDPATYPTATRVGAAAGAAHGTAYHAEHAYRFGLERVLDGLAILIARRPTSASRAGARRRRPS